MGGTVAVTIIKDGEYIQMSRWTNSMQWYIHHPEFLNGGKQFETYMNDWKKLQDEDHYYAAWKLMAPIEYGITIIDFDRKEIHSRQDYALIGKKLINMNGYKASWEKDRVKVEYIPKKPTSGFSMTFMPSSDDAEIFQAMWDADEVQEVHEWRNDCTDILHMDDYDNYPAFKKDAIFRSINEFGGSFIFIPKMRGFNVFNYEHSELPELFKLVKKIYFLTPQEKREWKDYIKRYDY
ncbi:hypothetical protein LCGC14_0195460 [marine sediment metagenome]|uniref:Uncharacterized protein n=1 Tax=marine sediment metagenome TaxID=412755 RepID=A0A0F9XND1_9ZZZZ